MSASSSVKVFVAITTLVAACMTLYAAYLPHLGSAGTESDRWTIEPDASRTDLTFDTQTALSDVGLYSGERDGDLNAGTFDAILRAESIFDTKLTGKPSEGLYQRLFFFGRNRDLIKTLQELFADRGEFDSLPTGDLDPKTAYLLENSWRKHDLEEWSLIDREVLVALILKISTDNLGSRELAAANPSLQ